MRGGEIERVVRLLVWAWSVGGGRRVGRSAVSWSEMDDLARAASVRIRTGETGGAMYLPRLWPDGSIDVVVDGKLPEHSRLFVVALVVAAAKEGTTQEDTVHEAFAWAVLRGNRSSRRRQIAELRFTLCAEWAEEQLGEVQGLAIRALLQAAGRTRSSTAFLLARAHRREGKPNIAAGWYERAAALAVAEGAYRRAAIAKVALGGLHMERGELEAAETWFERSLAVAAKYRKPEASAWPLHDLFNLSVERGDFERAEYYAARAMEAYGPRHPNLLRLAGGVAWSYLRRGEFEDARPIFEKVAALAVRRDVQVLAWAHVARCCAHLRDGDGYRFAVAQVWAVHGAAGGGVLMTEALAEVAAAAKDLGRVQDGSRAAGEAIVAARAREETAVLLRVLEMHAGDACEARALSTTQRGDERFAHRLVRFLQAA